MQNCFKAVYQFNSGFRISGKIPGSIDLLQEGNEHDFLITPRRKVRFIFVGVHHENTAIFYQVDRQVIDKRSFQKLYKM